MTMQERIVHYGVYNPASSIFKTGRNERAEATTVRCSCDSCPLLEAGQCVEMNVFGRGCPYGKSSRQVGPTRRSSKFYDWIASHNEAAKGIQWLKVPTRKMAFIGEYVYLPYSHMNACEAVPFLAHGGAFLNGSDFLSRSAWTLDAVRKLVSFRPQAMMGGEIVSYQREEVPRFIQHLREVDPPMWKMLAEVMPSIDVTPNYVGRMALIRTLVPPFEVPAKDDRYPVRWHWDGSVLATIDKSVYSSTWGGVQAKSLRLEVVPADDATIKVADNSWVDAGTQFVD